MKTKHDILLDWMKDAFAMEEALVETMERHAKDADDYPLIQEKIREHIEVTKGHALRIRENLEELGGSVSKVKSALGDVMGAMQGMKNRLAPDTIVKNALEEYASENFEIACYEAIAAAAREMGHEDTVTLARDIIKDEKEMADWLMVNLPRAVKDYLVMEEADER